MRGDGDVIQGGGGIGVTMGGGGDVLQGGGENVLIGGGGVVIQDGGGGGVIHSGGGGDVKFGGRDVTFCGEFAAGRTLQGGSVVGICGSAVGFRGGTAFCVRFSAAELHSGLVFGSGAVFWVWFSVAELFRGWISVADRLISGQRTNIVFAVLFLGLRTVENYPFFHYINVGP